MIRTLTRHPTLNRDITQTNAYALIYTHTPGFTDTAVLQTYTHADIHTHTHTRRLLLYTYVKQIWTRTNTYIRTHRLTQIHAHEGIPTQRSLYPETLRRRTNHSHLLFLRKTLCSGALRVKTFISYPAKGVHSDA